MDRAARTGGRCQVDRDTAGEADAGADSRCVPGGRVFGGGCGSVRGGGGVEDRGAEQAVTKEIGGRIRNSRFQALRRWRKSGNGYAVTDFPEARSPVFSI